MISDARRFVQYTHQASLLLHLLLLLLQTCTLSCITLPHLPLAVLGPTLAAAHQSAAAAEGHSSQRFPVPPARWLQLHGARAVAAAAVGAAAAGAGGAAAAAVAASCGGTATAGSGLLQQLLILLLNTS